MDKNKSIPTNQVITEWYDAMDAMSVNVSPTASTLLQAVLDQYDIQQRDRDVWQEFLRTDIDELPMFYSSLTDEERNIVDSRRASSWRDARSSKELLKG